MKRFDNVWDAIADTPEEAASLKARSVLMIALTELIRARGWTQAQAAHYLGLTQPRVSDLMCGKFNLFSLDALMDMAARAGLEPRLSVRKSAPRARGNLRGPIYGAAPAPKPARRKARA